MTERNGGIIEPGGTPLLDRESGHELVYIPEGVTLRSIDARPLSQTPDQLKAFIRAEVRKALQDITRELRMVAPAVSCPPRVPAQDLPAWARHEETGGTH